MHEFIVGTQRLNKEANSNVIQSTENLIKLQVLEDKLQITNEILGRFAYAKGKN